MRAPQAEWRKNSMIAVDAGAHLASIIRVLESEMPINSEKIPPKDYSKVLEKGPFAGVRFPNISAKANALFIFRELLHSFLITHPHLDHISAMSINTPALEYGREAKAIVALPSTIEAIKNHIFNDSIWPNLSDEDHGVGFVTYRRLIEGGNPRLGHGESRGYVNVCDGLATKCWSVSHGKCHRRTHSGSYRQRGDSFGFSQSDGYQFPTRRLSRISDDHGYIAAIAHQHNHNAGGYGQPQPGHGTPGAPPLDKDHMFEPVSSSAFFIRNDATGHEILVFGDIEPDSVSMSPRNHIVWDDAAPKIAKGLLKAIFIECSFDDSVRNEDLYGHLCPRHLIAELTFLANRVIAAREYIQAEANHELWNPPSELQMQDPPTPSDLRKKRKRGINGEISAAPELPPHSPATTSLHIQPTKAAGRANPMMSPPKQVSHYTLTGRQSMMLYWKRRSF
jgi:cAMP phosphodiesterases class-II